MRVTIIESNKPARSEDVPQELMPEVFANAAKITVGSDEIDAADITDLIEKHYVVRGDWPDGRILKMYRDD
jgi:hypothetical protein